MKYEFHVGDYVETKNDARGYVGNADEMIWQCTQSSNDYMYVAGYTYHIPVEELDGCFNRIGQYDFSKKGEGKIEPLCEEYIKSFPIYKTTTTGNDSEWRSIDIGAVSKKINEIIEAVNRLEEKVNGMAQS